MVANLEVNMKGKKALDKVYRRIDAAVSGSLGDSRVTDPFVPAEQSYTTAGKKKLSHRLESLQEFRLPLNLTDQLARYIREAPAQELARLSSSGFWRNYGMWTAMNC